MADGGSVVSNLKSEICLCRLPMSCGMAVAQG